jgi:urease accessory protein
VRSELAIELHQAGDGSVVARGSLAVAPFWCRWDGATLWFVGSAATPVGDDDITIDLRVGPGVQAAARSVAAMVVYAARGDGTRLTTRLHVAEGAFLTWQLEPAIVTARARHRGLLVADVAAGGRLVADELVVLGRSDEVAGPYAATTDLRRDGTPVSLTSFDTSVPGWSGSGGTGGAKVVGTRVVLGADELEPTPPNAASAVLRPEGGGAIATTVASDPGRARRQLDAVLPSPVPSATVLGGSVLARAVEVGAALAD